jgi:hypothetical protein
MQTFVFRMADSVDFLKSLTRESSFWNDPETVIEQAPMHRLGPCPVDKAYTRANGLVTRGRSPCLIGQLAQSSGGLIP